MSRGVDGHLLVWSAQISRLSRVQRHQVFNRNTIAHTLADQSMRESVSRVYLLGRHLICYGYRIYLFAIATVRTLCAAGCVHVYREVLVVINAGSLF